jgi:hypothetical protein
MYLISLGLGRDDVPASPPEVRWLSFELGTVLAMEARRPHIHLSGSNLAQCSLGRTLALILCLAASGVGALQRNGSVHCMPGTMQCATCIELNNLTMQPTLSCRMLSTFSRTLGATC